jgi:hypothetical protein
MELGGILYIIYINPLSGRGKGSLKLTWHISAVMRGGMTPLIGLRSSDSAQDHQKN